MTSGGGWVHRLLSSGNTLRERTLRAIPRGLPDITLPVFSFPVFAAETGTWIVYSLGYS